MLTVLVTLITNLGVCFLFTEFQARQRRQPDHLDEQAGSAWNPLNSMKLKADDPPFLFAFSSLVFVRMAQPAGQC